VFAGLSKPGGGTVVLNPGDEVELDAVFSVDDPCPANLELVGEPQPVNADGTLIPVRESQVDPAAPAQPAQEPAEPSVETLQAEVSTLQAEVAAEAPAAPPVA
jgi:hypothetical protein